MDGKAPGPSAGGHSVVLRSVSLASALTAMWQDRVEALSRTAVQRLIDEGSLTVNALVPTASHRLRMGDRIEVNVPEPQPAGLAPEVMPLDIIYEDSDLIVINKAAGMVVHPGAWPRIWDPGQCIAGALQRSGGHWRRSAAGHRASPRQGYIGTDCRRKARSCASWPTTPVQATNRCQDLCCPRCGEPRAD